MAVVMAQSRLRIAMTICKTSPRLNAPVSFIAVVASRPYLLSDTGWYEIQSLAARELTTGAPHTGQVSRRIMRQWEMFFAPATVLNRNILDRVLTEITVQKDVLGYV